MQKNYIPLDRTISDFQKMLKSSALSGTIEISVPDIIQQLRKEPLYSLDKVLEDVTSALVADNDHTNCLTGNNTEFVVVSKEKLDQVLNIIRNGGSIYAGLPECESE